MPTIKTEQAAPSSPQLKIGAHTAATVQVHALSAGHLTLPEKYFVYPASETSRKTVPSLAFLIQHCNSDTGKVTRIVFDLGLRRDIQRYSKDIQRHASTRQPVSTDPDVVKSLAAGGLGADDIDFVIYSHVHWDHIGEPRDFEKSTFVIGSGAWDLFQPEKPSSLRGSHSFFEPGILPSDRTIELSSPENAFVKNRVNNLPSNPGQANFYQPWTTLEGSSLEALDIFQDGTVNIVHSPGHLPGHINLLVRLNSGGQVYLAGDACHDRRIMRKEREIGEWLDTEGHICCVHANKKKAEETIDRIRHLEEQGIEVIFAHDFEWEEDTKNRSRFWGA